MSADLLRRAAQTLREHAAAATPGPWNVDGPWWHDRPNANAAEPTEMVSGNGDRREAVLLAVPQWGQDARLVDGNIRYGVLLHPPVAFALADWLDAVAQRGEEYVARYGDRYGPHDMAVTAWSEAIAVARAILREAVES